MSGRYNLFQCWPGVGGGVVRVFSLGSVEVGTVRLKWWGGGLAFFLFFYFAVSSPGGRLFVVGFCSSILVFLGYNWHYMRCCML